MQITLNPGYPDLIGRRFAWVGYGNGPSSYAVGGDQLFLPGYNNYIDAVFGPSYSVSGNYQVTPIPSNVGSRKTWSLKWSPVAAIDQQFPLTLGALSAAATTSAMTANGVGTVVVANTLSPGNFVLLTGGASGKAIFMNGQIVQVVTASSTQFTYNYGPAKSLSYVSAADTSLKFQVVQIGSTNLLQPGSATSQVATITAASVASQVATITAANTFIPGQFVVLQGLAAGEVTNGVIAQILTASTTQFTAAVQCPNVTNASDTGTATLLVTNGNVPITMASAETITGTTVAATAASASAAGAITVLPVSNNFIPGNLVVIEGLTNGAPLNGQIFPVLAASLTGKNMTANAYLTAAVTTGTADLGAASVLVSGYPTGASEVYAGTNLSAEQVQIGGFGGEY
jgi:hypothetical protein